MPVMYSCHIVLILGGVPFTINNFSMILSLQLWLKSTEKLDFCSFFWSSRSACSAIYWCLKNLLYSIDSMLSMAISLNKAIAFNTMNSLRANFMFNLDWLKFQESEKQSVFSHHNFNQLLLLYLTTSFQSSLPKQCHIYLLTSNVCCLQENLKFWS